MNARSVQFKCSNVDFSLMLYWMTVTKLKTNPHPMCIFGGQQHIEMSHGHPSVIANQISDFNWCWNARTILLWSKPHCWSRAHLKFGLSAS